MLRPLSPISPSVPALRVISYATATTFPIGISLDRTTLYGAKITGDGALYQSVDDGATWTSVKVLAPTTDVVLGLVETDDGEALCYTQAAAASPGYIYKSTGWSTSHTTATWAKVLTTTGGYIRPVWAGNAFSFGDDTILAGSSRVGITSEYGPQTTVTFASGNADTTDLAKARRVFVTGDYGATWTKVFDISAYFPNATNLHIHSVAYDPYWDRFWLSFGDTTTNTVGANGYDVLYSDDRGATWTPLATSNAGGGVQPVGIMIAPDAIILGSDNLPGIERVSRKGYRKVGPVQYPVVVGINTGALILTYGVHKNRRQPGAPYLVGLAGLTAENATAIHISPDGAAWFELWRDENLRTNQSNGLACFGPTVSGKMVAIVGQTSSTNWLLRGELVDPGPRKHVRRSTFVGDGTTTVFNYPHGLGARPSDFLAVDTLGSSASAVISADATNIIATFATAPANAVKLAFDYRYSA